MALSNFSRVWIFDLDDTLHNASAHIFPVMNRAMTQYIMDTLDLDEASAHKLRQHYWRIYGATLKGLMRHHGTDPYHFLYETHRLITLPEMVLQTKRLRHMLQSLPGRKVVFTNAPMDYALRVLD
ncbi:MAG: pyrimidine 5'-nucleotidase, partial [Methylotenera sp.]